MVSTLLFTFYVPFHVGKQLHQKSYYSLEETANRCKTIATADMFIDGSFGDTELDSIHRSKLNDDEEDADQQKSLSDAGKYSGVSGRGGTAIKYALAQIGDKYVFGADGLTYWDCSGLTMRAFGAAGVSLPHSSRAQYRYGKAIARKDLQPGDLVFFGKPISHVAIYLGPDRMLHAPRSGSRVKIANMNMGRKPYIGARRL